MPDRHLTKERHGNEDNKEGVVEFFTCLFYRMLLVRPTNYTKGIYYCIKNFLFFSFF